MLPVPAIREIVSSNGCVMPAMPAVPQNSAYTDQPSAAMVPIEIRVSMVAVPWRRLLHAALWNGHAPHATTGAASVNDSHCQLVNCNAGTMAMAITGTVSASDTSSRWRSEAVGSAASGSEASRVSADFGGLGSCAV